MGDDGRDENEGGHAQRDAAARFVNLLDNEVVTALGMPTKPLIKQADRETGERKKEEQPGMLEPGPRRLVQAPPIRPGAQG